VSIDVNFDEDAWSFKSHEPLLETKELRELAPPKVDPQIPKKSNSDQQASRGVGDAFLPSKSAKKPRWV